MGAKHIWPIVAWIGFSGGCMQAAVPEQQSQKRRRNEHGGDPAVRHYDGTPADAWYRINGIHRGDAHTRRSAERRDNSWPAEYYGVVGMRRQRFAQCDCKSDPGIPGGTRAAKRGCLERRGLTDVPRPCRREIDRKNAGADAWGGIDLERVTDSLSGSGRDQ